jgi:hypothetical protein
MRLTYVGVDWLDLLATKSACLFSVLAGRTPVRTQHHSSSLAFYILKLNDLLVWEN